jgi:hypothetical protein
MVKFKIAAYGPNPLFLMLLSLAIAFNAGCQAIQYKSRFLQKQEAQGSRYTKSASEIRRYLDDLAGVFAGTIEQAADRIIEKTSSADIRRHALLWKINGIPTAYRALFQPDPAVAILDVWAFSMQMIDYFDRGPGKNDFGRWQPIALDASRKLETRVRLFIAEGMPNGDIRPLQGKIQSWTLNHPIARDFMFRDTTAPELASIIGNQAMDTFETVGRLAVRLEVVTQQLTAHINLLTKQARWQAELVATELPNQPDLQNTLATVVELSRSMTHLVSLAEQSSALIAHERKAIFASIQHERTASLTTIDQQRTATLAFMAKERSTIVNALQSERQTIVQNLQSEREATLRSIDEMRRVAFNDLESAGNRMLDKARNHSERLIDHLFVRGLFFLFAGLLGGLVSAILWFRLKGRARTGVGE